MFNAIVAAPFGHLGIRTQAGEVREIVYLPTSFAEQAPDNALAARVARQCLQYCDDPAFRFDLPLAQAGSPFQQRVWQAIVAIPCGKVMTYGAIAKMLDSGPRAVGGACGANWFPLVIPCHRVVAASGLGGFANYSADHADGGFHLNIKRWLLRHEGVALA